MKNILVTGSKGFIGERLVKKFMQTRYKVIGFDKDNGDIANEGALKHFEKENISYVFHLAGKTFVPDSWESPSEFYRINVLGTQNILDFCRRTGVALTYVSSYVYGIPHYLPINEAHPLSAYNPYSHSKILAEEICRFYQNHFNVDLTILRPFNVYGPNQSDKFLIPELIQKILNPNISIIEVSDLRPKRDYLFIDDLIDALVLSMEGPQDIYNVGSGCSVSVRELIDLLIEVTGIEKEVISNHIERPFEIFDLYADIKKISNNLKWEPKTGIKEGLTACINNKYTNNLHK